MSSIFQWLQHSNSKTYEVDYGSFVNFPWLDVEKTSFAFFNRLFFSSLPKKMTSKKQNCNGTTLEGLDTQQPFQVLRELWKTLKLPDLSSKIFIPANKTGQPFLLYGNSTLGLEVEKCCCLNIKFCHDWHPFLPASGSPLFTKNNTLQIWNEMEHQQLLLSSRLWEYSHYYPGCGRSVNVHHVHHCPILLYDLHDFHRIWQRCRRHRQRKSQCSIKSLKSTMI